MPGTRADHQGQQRIAALRDGFFDMRLDLFVDLAAQSIAAR
jgi:hypothetical protein